MDSAKIPEEVLLMASLFRESQGQDQLLVDRPSGLATGSGTIKKAIGEYMQHQRIAADHQSRTNGVGGVPPLNQDFVPMVTPVTTDLPIDGNSEQLEFRFESTIGESIVNLLKEISLKLTTQNKILKSLVDDKLHLSEERIPVLTPKFGKSE